MPQPIGEYRGCTLLLYNGTRDPPLYGSPCTASLRFTVARVKQDIDALSQPPPPPPPEPGKVFVETYRGVDIYYDAAVHRHWFEYEGVPYGPATLNEAHTWIDTLLQPPPPPEEHWEHHSTYRDIRISIWMPSGAFYQATFGGEIHNTTTLSTLQAEIDTFLDPKHTSLTISAPPTVEPNETFIISGNLYEAATGVPIPNQTIDLSYNGVSLGSALTGIDGDYLIQAAISTEGSYTLKASFAGTTTLGASTVTSRLSTGAPDLAALAPVAAVALLAYFTMRK